MINIQIRTTNVTTCVNSSETNLHNVHTRVGLPYRPLRAPIIQIQFPVCLKINRMASKKLIRGSWTSFWASEVFLRWSFVRTIRRGIFTIRLSRLSSNRHEKRWLSKHPRYIARPESFIEDGAVLDEFKAKTTSLWLNPWRIAEVNIFIVIATWASMDPCWKVKVLVGSDLTPCITTRVKEEKSSE